MHMGDSIKKFSQTVKPLWIDFDDRLPCRMTRAHMAHRICCFFKRMCPFDHRGNLACLNQLFDERQIICIGRRHQACYRLPVAA